MVDPDDEVVGLRGAKGRLRRLGDLNAIPKYKIRQVRPCGRFSSSSWKSESLPVERRTVGP